MPETVLCRHFLPARFDKVPDNAALGELVGFNPEIKLPSLRFKNSEQVQGGAGDLP